MKKIMLGVALLSLTGCATILNEEMQKINVSSTAAKIKGNIDGVPFEGPGIVSVKRTKADRIMNVDTDGCQKQTILTSTVDPKFFINILSGGTFGSTTDYSSEKMWKYQDQVVVSCK
jgi:hypothetical protein